MIKDLILLKIQNMMDIKDVLPQWFRNVLIKNFCKTCTVRDLSYAGSGIKNKNISNKESTEELHKLIIRKLKKKKTTLTFYRQYLGC